MSKSIAAKIRDEVGDVKKNNENRLDVYDRQQTARSSPNPSSAHTFLTLSTLDIVQLGSLPDDKDRETVLIVPFHIK